MMYLLNGVIRVGPSEFYRIDNTDLVDHPDYDPIQFMQQPPILLNEKRFTRDQAVAFVDSLNKVGEKEQSAT